MPPSLEPVNPAADVFAVPPDPAQASTLDDFVERLRLLKVWAGGPSYERITDRINAAWSAAGRPAGELVGRTTVVDCFRPGRRRLNTDLVIAVVEALHPEVGYVEQWRQALRVVGGEAQAASQIRVQDTLPQDLAAFTGRESELDQLREALHRTQRDGGAVVISAIEGMAGVGKTQLAVHAGHILSREQGFDRVLFVNLRGFHPDPALPPADPAAVLDGFLRLLGVPGQQIPHDLPARAAAYRDRLAGSRTLVVLDNAADTEQVRPLLPATPGCLTLVTSRRSLTDLRPATHLAVDVFTPDEAVAFLIRAVPEVAVGSDPQAAARIAQRCGHLPLALGLIAGRIRGTPGWTLTDHADRLDEHHRERRLESRVELALDLSYQRLSANRGRLLRLAALHPGPDLDAYAAAALAGLDLTTAEEHLHQLCSDHLLQLAAPGRYGFHDLVRAFAIGRAGDQDSPPHRRAALTRLFDYYQSTAATAMDVAYPYARQHHPTPPPGDTSAPDLADRNRADLWLDAELTNLLAAAQHAAENGWPEHTWQLSTTLDRHLYTRGRYSDAETLYQRALDLAYRLGNHLAEMNALNGLGYIYRILARYAQADDHFKRALQIAQDIGDRGGERQALTGLGTIDWWQGRYEHAGDHYGQALQIAQEIGDRGGERQALTSLGTVHRMLGQYAQAGDHFERARQLAQEIGDRSGELNSLHCLANLHLVLGRDEQASGDYLRAFQLAQAIGDPSGEWNALLGLGHIDRRLGRHEQADDHFKRALQLAQVTGDRLGELQALHGLGEVYRTLGRHDQASDCYQQVLGLARELGNNNWQFEALQALGRLHHATGHSDLALSHHQRALQLATDLAQPADQARAHDGLAHAHHTTGRHDQARVHWQHALDILIHLGTDQTYEIQVSIPNIQAHLAQPLA